MTTIAADGRTMAGDGRMSVRSVVAASSCAKIRMLSNGDIVGVSGDAHVFDLFAEWWEGEARTKPPKASFSALILKPSGQAYHCGESCRPMPIDLPFAIGTGAEMAIGAMDAGASPAEAVKIAMQRDIYSGGKITVLSLDAS